MNQSKRSSSSSFEFPADAVTKTNGDNAFAKMNNGQDWKNRKKGFVFPKGDTDFHSESDKGTTLLQKSLSFISNVSGKIKSIKFSDLEAFLKKPHDKSPLYEDDDESVDQRHLDDFDGIFGVAQVSQYSKTSKFQVPVFSPRSVSDSPAVSNGSSFEPLGALDLANGSSFDKSISLKSATSFKKVAVASEFPDLPVLMIEESRNSDLGVTDHGFSYN